MAPPKAPSIRPGVSQSQGEKRMSSSSGASNQPPKKPSRGAESRTSAPSRRRGSSVGGGPVRQREQANDSQRRESGSSSAVSRSSARQFGTSQVSETETSMVVETQLAVESPPSQSHRNSGASRANSLSSQARPPSSLAHPMPRPPQSQRHPTGMPRPPHAASPAVTSSFEEISLPSASDGQRNEHAPVTSARPSSGVTQPLHQDTSKRWSSRNWSDTAIQPSGLHSSPPSSRGSSAAGARSIFRFEESDMTGLVYETARLLEMYMWEQQPFMTGRELEEVSSIISMDTQT
jgi:hypothetical protein